MICVCVCVCERERERERDQGLERSIDKLTPVHAPPGDRTSNTPQIVIQCESHCNGDTYCVLWGYIEADD